jgi:hypothetical protein
MKPARKGFIKIMGFINKSELLTLGLLALKIYKLKSPELIETFFSAHIGE